MGALRLVEDWCAKENLRVNPDKTVFITFTKMRNVTGLKTLVRFRLVEQVKYQGIYIDKKLFLNAHLD